MYSGGEWRVGRPLWLSFFGTPGRPLTCKHARRSVILRLVKVVANVTSLSLILNTGRCVESCDSRAEDGNEGDAVTPLRQIS